MSRDEVADLVLSVIRCSRGIRRLALAEDADGSKPALKRFSISRVLVELIEGWCAAMVERHLPELRYDGRKSADIADGRPLAELEARLLAWQAGSERSSARPPAHLKVIVAE